MLYLHTFHLPLSLKNLLVCRLYLPIPFIRHHRHKKTSLLCRISSKEVELNIAIIVVTGRLKINQIFIHGSYETKLFALFTVNLHGIPISNLNNIYTAHIPTESLPTNINIIEIYETNTNKITWWLTSNINNKIILKLTNTKVSYNNIPNDAYPIQLRFTNIFTIHNNNGPISYDST